MKVLLVNPSQVHLVNRRGKIYNRVWPPLELANCAALLERDGHEVAVIDANALGLAPAAYGPDSARYDKVFISSSSLDRWQCPNVDLEPFLDSVAGVRRFTDEVYVLGVHGTVKPREILDLTRAKAVVRGEPEITVTEICRQPRLGEVAGVAFMENGRLVETKEQRPLDLDMLPRPAFHLLPMSRYHYEVLGPRFALFEGSRGCTFRCQFCLLKMYGQGIRRKSPARLLEDVEHGIRRHGVKTAYFMDLEFTVFRERVMEFCEMLIVEGLDFRWTCQTRFDLVDEELLQKMKRAGCRLIHFGVEAGTDDRLREVNKRITVRQIEDGMRLVHAANLESACFFILGFPGAGEEETEATIGLARRLNPTYALFHIAVPYPGTAMSEKFPESCSRGEGVDLFPEACRSGAELEALKRRARRAYTGFYVRPRYIMSRLAKGDLRSLVRQVRLFLGYL